MKRDGILTSITQNPAIEVLIIGAGINGIATFRELALQGVNVLLVDRGDFCSGASAASSHMAHGGIRYLENGEFRLVREAVAERNRLLQNAPHYVTPLPTVIPIFKRFSGILNAPLKFFGLLDKPVERGAAIIKVGLMMYDAYTGKERTVPRHEFLSRTDALTRYPHLNPQIINVAEYYDGLIRSPERLCMELIADAEAAGGRALNYVGVTEADRSHVRLMDEVSEENILVQPQVVINAAGPWIDFVNRRMNGSSRFIGGTKGSHIVLNHPELRQAIGEHEFFFENDDGRIVLICPLEDRVLLGTSDIPIDNPDDAFCTEEEIDYFLQMTPRIFPNIEISRAHIVFAFSGVRPLPAMDAKSTGQISRDHAIKPLEPDDGVSFPILNLVGGKWTTFRAFAEQTANETLRRLGMERKIDTKSMPIGGGRSYPITDADKLQWIEQQSQSTCITEQQMRTLFDRYGTLASTIVENLDELNGKWHEELQHHPDYLLGEVAYLARAEKVVHLDDFVLRRSSLAMLGELTHSLLVELADVIGDICDWSTDRREAEVERSLLLLTEQHRVRL